MTRYYGRLSTANSITHYGVMGMHWGQHKANSATKKAAYKSNKEGLKEKNKLQIKLGQNIKIQLKALNKLLKMDRIKMHTMHMIMWLIMAINTLMQEWTNIVTKALKSYILEIN